MSIVKLSLLISSSLSFHLGLARTSSVNDEDRVMVTTFRERLWKHVGVPIDFFLKGTTWLATFGESAVIVTTLLGRPRSRDTLLYVLGPASASHLSAPFVLGASLVIAGGVARVASFRALGPYYTFVQCIRKDHRLVTTGPYAVVRHPGYAGLLLSIVGWGIAHGAPGSWLRTSGVLRRCAWARVALGLSCAAMAACLGTVFRRSAEEDRFLMRRFGEEWRGWAEKVKYRLVPLVY